MDPEKKSLNFIFPTKYVIPKSLKLGHWLSEITWNGLDFLLGQFETRHFSCWSHSYGFTGDFLWFFPKTNECPPEKWIVSWVVEPPLWNIFSSDWIISPIGENKKYLKFHHLVMAFVGDPFLLKWSLFSGHVFFLPGRCGKCENISPL